MQSSYYTKRKNRLLLQYIFFTVLGVVLIIGIIHLLYKNPNNKNNSSTSGKYTEADNASWDQLHAIRVNADAESLPDGKGALDVKKFLNDIAIDSSSQSGDPSKDLVISGIITNKRKDSGIIQVQIDYLDTSNNIVKTVLTEPIAYSPGLAANFSTPPISLLNITSNYKTYKVSLTF